MTITKLGDLDSVLETYNPFVYQKLQMPVSKEEIILKTKFLPFPLPDFLIELFGWRDGILVEDEDEITSCWIFTYGIFISIDEAVREYKTIPTLNRRMNKKIVRESLFPLFSSGAEELIFVDIDSHSESYGSLFIFTYTDPEMDYIMKFGDSLDTIIDATVECYKMGVFQEYNIADSKKELENAIFYKHNPNSEYWKFYCKNNPDEA